MVSTSKPPKVKRRLISAGSAVVFEGQARAASRFAALCRLAEARSGYAFGVLLRHPNRPAELIENSGFEAKRCRRLDYRPQRSRRVEDRMSRSIKLRPRGSVVAVQLRSGERNADEQRAARSHKSGESFCFGCRIGYVLENVVQHDEIPLSARLRRMTTRDRHTLWRRCIGGKIRIDAGDVVEASRVKFSEPLSVSAADVEDVRLSCASRLAQHSSEERFADHSAEQPSDGIGLTCRMAKSRHLKRVFQTRPPAICVVIGRVIPAPVGGWILQDERTVGLLKVVKLVARTELHLMGNQPARARA